MALGKVDNVKKNFRGDKKNKRTELLRLLANNQNTSNPGIDSKILGGKKTSVAEEIIPGFDKWDYVKILKTFRENGPISRKTRQPKE